MYNQVIKFIGETKSMNEYGDSISEYSERIVFAELKSIGQTEFYQAHAVGLRPELKFVIADFMDYQNEKNLKYREFGASEEEIYSVIRTFRVGNELEIICKRGVD